MVVHDFGIMAPLRGEPSPQVAPRIASDPIGALRHTLDSKEEGIRAETSIVG